MSKKVSFQELAKHNTAQDCWVAINGKVYDLTSFLGEHPAGSRIILKQAGKDGTQAFTPYHASDIIQTLGKDHLCVGLLDNESAPVAGGGGSGGGDKGAGVAAAAAKPPLGTMLNVFDFEDVAKSQMSAQGWAYYSSGADDEVTLRENHTAFHRLWLRPRVMRNVSQIDMRCTMLSHPMSFPVYVSATALGRLAHPDGEVALTRACYKEHIIQMMPTLASCSLDEMMQARQGAQVQFFQLYVNSDRGVARKLVEKAERGGAKALFITVDAPMLGRREKDMRHKFVDAAPDEMKSGSLQRGSGTARAITQFIDPSLCWEDLKWFKSITRMPIVLKGIQCGEDAVLAYEAGIQGIVVSNHGGRQLDYSRSGIETLEEVVLALRRVNAPPTFEVYMDGGVRRGSDIFKAVALGAKCVGVGRPVLFGLAAYGQEGVERVLQLLKEELHMCMALMGTPTIESINQSYVISRNLQDHVAPVPRSNLFQDTYIPLLTQSRSKL